MKKIIKFIAAALTVVTAAFAFAACTGTPTTFTKGEVSVTLDSFYREQENENVYFYYQSVLGGEFCVCSKDGFDKISKEKTLAEYADAVKTANKVETEVSERNGYLYFTIDNGNLFMITAMYKSEQAFYTLNFGCAKKDKKDKERILFSHADSVTFATDAENA